MDFELDPFADILPRPVTNARAGGKFEPKANPRPRKESSVSDSSTLPDATKEVSLTVAPASPKTIQIVPPIDGSDDGLTDAVGSCSSPSNLLQAKEPLKNIKDSSSEVPNCEDPRTSKLMNFSSPVAGIREDTDFSDALPFEVATSGSNTIRCSSLRKSEGRADSLGSGMEPFDDILLQLATSNARASGKFQPKSRPRPKKDHSAPPNVSGKEPTTLASTVSDTTQSISPLDVADNSLTDPFGSSLAASGIMGSKVPLKDNEESFPDIHRSSELDDSLSGLGLMRQDIVSTDALDSDVALSGGHGTWDSSLETSEKKVDSMEFVLDPFVDILPEAATARAGAKFKPKVKPRPKKGTSASSVSNFCNFTKEKLLRPVATGSDTRQSTQHVDGSCNRTTDTVDLSLITLDIPGIREPFEDLEGPLSGVPFSNDTRSLGLKNPSNEFVASDDLDVAATPNSNYGWHSSSQKLTGQNADIFSGLEYLDDFLSQPTTSMLNAASQSQQKVDAKAGDKFLTDRQSDTNSRRGSLGLSETPSFHASNTEVIHASNKEGEPGVQVLSSVEFSAPGACDATQVYPFPELLGNQDSVTCTEAAVTNGEFYIRNQRLQTEAGPVETDYMHESSLPSFQSDGVNLTVNKDTNGFAETLLSDAAIPRDVMDSQVALGMPENVSSKTEKTKPMAYDQSQKPQTSSVVGKGIEAGRQSRRLRKRVAASDLVHEAESEDQDGVLPTESPSTSVVDDDDDDNDDDSRVESASCKRRYSKKSREAEPEKEKPVRKRKKPNGVPDKSTKEPSKKFSHSTRRNKRCVDKVLLETPDDEIDHQKLPIKQLILLAEFRERIASKEASSSRTPLNQSAENSHPWNDPYKEGEAFASEQDMDFNDDQAGSQVPKGSSYFNYHSYMDRTPIVRWSKQDTELFYKAVGQFGTDFSMIQQLFPGRTRNQIKLKYKKEERQHPLRLSEAVQSRAKDHSHFELVIERLQQAAKAEQDLNGNDSIGVTGEDETEDMTRETNEEAAESKQEEKEDEDTMGTDDAKVQSPANFDDSDDDLQRWNQYESSL